MPAGDKENRANVGSTYKNCAPSHPYSLFSAAALKPSHLLHPMILGPYP